jgi:hypothetical protein
MNTLTARDVRQMLDGLAQIEELTNWLRSPAFKAPFGVPWKNVYAAAEAAENIRAKLLDASLADIEVEAATQ